MLSQWAELRFCLFVSFFFFKQKTAYEMRISDWSSDVCSSDLSVRAQRREILRHVDREGEAARLHALAAKDQRRVAGRQIGEHRAQIWHGDDDQQRVEVGHAGPLDRKSVVQGTSVSVRIAIGGRRIKNKTNRPVKHRTP